MPLFSNAKGIELDQLCKELLTLKNLIVTASAAATVEGILLPIVSHMQQLDPTGTLRWLLLNTCTVFYTLFTNVRIFVSFLLMYICKRFSWCRSTGISVSAESTTGRLCMYV